MSLYRAAENQNASIVLPAWIAGIQIRKDASGNIHVNLIPALHAGMTNREALPEVISVTYFQRQERSISNG